MTSYPSFPFILTGKEPLCHIATTPYGEFTVNNTGASILKWCNGSHSTDTIAAGLHNWYGGDRKDIEHKTEKFFHKLAANGRVWLKRKPMRWFTPPAPQSVFREITSRCNLRCLHCVVSAGEKWLEDLPTARCIELIDEWAETGVRELTFSGGEPLLRDDFFLLAETAKSRGLSISPATNGALGALINHVYAAAIKSLGMPVQISLDGSNAETYSRVRGRKEAFEDLLKGIECALSNIELTAGTVMSTETIPEIEHIIALVESLGIPYFRLIPFISYGRGMRSRHLEPAPSVVGELTKNMAKRRSRLSCTLLPMEFEKILSPPTVDTIEPSEPSYCGGALEYCTITSSGEVLPCHYFEGVTADSVRNRSFCDIWHSSRFLNYFRSPAIEDIEGACRQCAWLATCRGGCKAANFSMGRLFASNRHCWLAEQVVEEQGSHIDN